MRNVFIIAKRELQAYFDSLIAYMLIIIFLGIAGFFTWIFPSSNVFLQGQANLDILLYVFSVPNIALFIIAPALTMRLLAEEKKSGTLELLLTKAVSDRQVVFGKWLSAMILIFIALALTLPYYITVMILGNVDHGATIFGYVAILLMAGTYISIGIFASSLTRNQILAFLIGFIINLLFYFVFYLVSQNSSGFFSELFSFLSIPSHYQSLARGVIDTTDLIYFASMIILPIVFAELSLSSRNAED